MSLDIIKIKGVIVGKLRQMTRIVHILRNLLLKVGIGGKHTAGDLIKRGIPEQIGRILRLDNADDLDPDALLLIGIHAVVLINLVERQQRFHQRPIVDDDFDDAVVSVGLEHPAGDDRNVFL